MRSSFIEKWILFEDRDLLVLHKPSGIAVQSAGVGSMDLESGAKNYLATKNPEKLPYLGVVHRLDQPVEGVLVFAKTQMAAKELSRQMNAGEWGKNYYAVTEKCPEKASGVLEDILVKENGKNISKVADEGTPGGKKARLSYEVLEELSDSRTESGKKYLLRIQLYTGRHHQIRVQMAHAGMPLLGDKKYHPEEKSGYSLALCCYRLDLVHPKKKKEMRWEIRPEGAAFSGFQFKEEGE